MFKIFSFTLSRNQIKVIMKSVLFAYITSVILLSGIPLTATAQRTSTGKAFLGISQHVSVYSVPSGGMSLEGGQYLLHSYWKGWIRAVDWNQKVSGVLDGEGSPVLFDHILWSAGGSWMYRLFATYGRRLCLYAGAGAVIGLNHYESFRRLPDELTGAFPKVEFVYGAEPALELELFPFRKTALILGIQSPFTFASSLPTDLWHLSGSLGIRFNL